MRVAVLVNGPYGSGRPALAPALAVELGVPLLAHDAVADTLRAALMPDPAIPDAQAVDADRLGLAATEVMWTMLAGCPLGGVVDSWLRHQQREDVLHGLRRARADHVVEVWCPALPEGDATLPVDDDPATGPLGLGPVIRHAADRPFDVRRTADAVREALRDPASAVAGR